ncbi:serine/threonine-protein kinase [Streptomyces lateritius]|uniref:serine/threonine-protein kinase n=1 Tax=Streptomyces lateritius TaxID=67313 RepID=UPI00167C0532|nr:serine/threonine-protein kinase [Streptomyces lateritius]GGT87667.1 serine/threonine protein kinase [Streptomyces lateritius]
MQPLEPEAPRTIGGYRLLGRLGSGGMGRVYLARNEGGRTVAVKIVHPHLSLDEQFRARFRREVEAARRVGGRWTAPVLDADPEADVPWVATGYVAGPTLDRAVGTVGPLPEQAVRALGAGLAEALAGVHALGLVHRDVKPSNVLLTLDGPRLIDFGIARAIEGTASLTSTGVSVGSPGYMAPEQILGQGATAAADVFSLGAVLAYAATGAPPFRGDTSATLLYKVVHEEPELDAGLRGELREMVAGCLSKGPAARPDPEEVAALLAPHGAAALMMPGWLPGPLVEEVSRTAVRLLELDATSALPEALASPTAPAPGPYESGPVPFTAPSVSAPGAFGPPVEPSPGPWPDAGAGVPVSIAAVPTPRAAPKTPPGRGAPAGTGPAPLPAPHRKLSLSLAAGRRVSCTVALAVTAALAGVALGSGYLLGLMPGGRDADTAGTGPSRSASPAPPPAGTRPTTPAGSVPAAFVGSWTGPTTERNGSPHGDLTAVVGKGKTGEDVVRTSHVISVLGTTVRCHGIGRLTSATATELRVADRTDPDRPGTAGLCTSGTSSFTLTLNADGTLAYRSDEEAAGRPTGTLRKS